MSHRYSTTIRMGAAHFDISFGGQRVDLAALLYGQPHVEQYRILREASAAVCKLHGIGRETLGSVVRKAKRARKIAAPPPPPHKPRPAVRVPLISSEATL